MTEFQTQPWLGWAVVDRRWFRESPYDGSAEIEGVMVAIGERGVGHDDPSTHRSAYLDKTQALKLAVAIIEAAT